MVGGKKTGRLATISGVIVAAIGTTSIAGIVLGNYRLMWSESGEYDHLQPPKILPPPPNYKRTVKGHKSESRGLSPEGSPGKEWALTSERAPPANALEERQSQPRIRLPNVLLIGSQKAGSSALSNWLFFDRGLCAANTFEGEPKYWRKEVHFFDNDERYLQGARFYAKRFRRCFEVGNTTLSMDATPNTLPFAQRVRQVYDTAGDGQADALKIVAILREPTSRMLSLYNHKVKASGGNNVSPAFWKSIIDQDGNIVPFSHFAGRILQGINSTDGTCLRKLRSAQCYDLYSHHIEEWMKYFNHNQILVLSYDELQRDQKSLMWRVEEFLGLKKAVDRLKEKDEIKESNTQQHSLKISYPPCDTQAMLAQALAKANENLYELLEKKKGPNMEQRPFPRFLLSNCTKSVVLR